MSHRSTRSQENLAGIDEADLYRTPPATRRRINTKKSVSRTPSTSDTEREGKEQQENSSPLDRFIDQTPRPSKTSIMAESAAQAEIRRLQQQLAQAEAALTEQSDSVDPEEADRMRQHSVDPEEAERMRQHEIQLRRQEEEENNRARHHELEMARLQLQIEQAKAANSTPAAINITQREDKVASFKKEVAAKSLKTSFKLEGSTNYESWRDEALTQALAIKAKHILINKEMACPAGITDDDERKIWEVKSEAFFDMLLAGVKPAIRQTIKARINEDDKSATELWMAIETEFRIHAVDIRTDLFRRFTTATIEANNVQQYISQFRDTCGKLKQMGFEIPI
jgi:hypothetical protein